MSAPEYHDSLTAPTLETQAKTAHEQAQGKLVGAQAVEVHPNAVAERGLKGAQTTEAYGKAKESNANAASKQADTQMWMSLMGGATQNGGAIPAGTDPSSFVHDLVTLRADPAMVQGMVRKNPQLAMALEQATQKLDPQFSMADYGQRVKALSSIGSGKDADQVAYVNRLIQHAHGMKEAITNLDNGRVPLTNWIGNEVAPHIYQGKTKDAVNAFTSNAAPLTTEFAKLARGSGVMSKEEVDRYIKGFDVNASPSAQLASLNKLMELAGAQTGEIARRYNEATHGYGNSRQILSPVAAKYLKTDFPDQFNFLQENYPTAFSTNTSGTVQQPGTPTSPATTTTTPAVTDAAARYLASIGHK